MDHVELPNSLGRIARAGPDASGRLLSQQEGSPKAGLAPGCCAPGAGFAQVRPAGARTRNLGPGPGSGDCRPGGLTAGAVEGSSPGS